MQDRQPLTIHNVCKASQLEASRPLRNPEKSLIFSKPAFSFLILEELDRVDQSRVLWGVFKQADFIYFFFFFFLLGWFEAGAAAVLLIDFILFAHH